jgi:hypothetical protein
MDARQTVLHWSLPVLGAALVAAIILWNNVAKVKEASETLLAEYEKLLSEARYKMAEPGADEEAEEGEAGDSSARRPPSGAGDERANSSAAPPKRPSGK